MDILTFVASVLTIIMAVVTAIKWFLKRRNEKDTISNRPRKR